MRADGGSQDHIDSALFLGMNSTDEAVRIACKGFFVRHVDRPLTMSLEQVGHCDDVIWGFSRKLQDAYYPFMDSLHTVMTIERSGYEEQDLRRAIGDQLPEGLPTRERLLLGMVLNRRGMLHTVNSRLLAHPGMPVREPDPVGEHEPLFPEYLERLYQTSLALRVQLDPR